MKNKLLLFMSILMIFGVLVACNEGIIVKEESKEEENAKSINGLISHFEISGFEIGEKQRKAAEMIGGIEGVGVKLNGESVEIYEYKEDSKDLHEIKENGEHELEGFGSFPAIANGNFVLINHEKHSDELEIVEAFNSY